MKTKPVTRKAIAFLRTLPEEQRKAVMQTAYYISSRSHLCYTTEEHVKRAASNFTASH